MYARTVDVIAGLDPRSPSSPCSVCLCCYRWAAERLAANCDGRSFGMRCMIYSPALNIQLILQRFELILLAEFDPQFNVLHKSPSNAFLYLSLLDEKRGILVLVEQI